MPVRAKEGWRFLFGVSVCALFLSVFDCFVVWRAASCQARSGLSVAASSVSAVGVAVAVRALLR